MKLCNTYVAPIQKVSQNDKQKAKIENVSYAFAIGSLMYVQVCTCPDIAFVISTKEHLLTYKRSTNLEVIGYFDSDYGSCLDDHKFISGYFLCWQEELFLGKTLTTTSTMEVEYVACYKVTRQAVWLRNFIFGFYLVESISKPLTIYCNNFIVVCFSHLISNICLLERRLKSSKLLFSIYLHNSWWKIP
ncbi:hypothetical protein CR513_13846, partial [Mucuna pruriens]